MIYTTVCCVALQRYQSMQAYSYYAPLPPQISGKFQDVFADTLCSTVDIQVIYEGLLVRMQLRSDDTYSVEA